MNQFTAFQPTNTNPSIFPSPKQAATTNQAPLDNKYVSRSILRVPSTYSIKP